MSTSYQITNEVTGQVIKFVKSKQEEDFLEMESVYASFAQEPPSHYHPFQEEVFEVLAGELTVRIDSEVRTYRKGEHFRIVPGIHHSMWNSGYADTMVNWKVFPALQTELFLNILTHLANEGKTNSQGVPSLPLMVFLLKKFEDSFRLTKLNMTKLSVLYTLLFPIFLICGYHKQAALKPVGGVGTS